MYNSYGEFKTAYEGSKMRGVMGGPMDPQAAYIVYEKSRRPPLRCSVLGRHIDDASPDACGRGIQWFGGGGLVADANSPTGVSGAVDHVAQNFGVVAETPAGPNDKFVGSILAAGNWDYAVNDTWVIGGAHGQIPFYCASPLTRDNLISPRRKALTITGREVLGLLSFGYKLVTHVKLGQLFQVKDANTARRASFRSYDAAAKQYSTENAMVSFFNAHGLGI